MLQWWGNVTGTYRFKNHFYGITTMPAEFRRVMDTLTKKLPQAPAFFDDILFCFQGNQDQTCRIDKENHEKMGQRTLR